MKKVNIFEAKARLSECIEAAHRGEEVVICRRNRPVAELRAIGAVRAAPRPVGGAKGLEIPAAFFEPLPDDFVETFYAAIPAPASSRVAKSRPSFGGGRAVRRRRAARP